MKDYKTFLEEEMATLDTAGGMGEIQMPDVDNGVIGSGDIPDNMLSFSYEEDDDDDDMDDDDIKALMTEALNL